MADDSFQQPQQWSQELGGSFVDMSTMFRNGPDNKAQETEVPGAHQRKGISGKVTDYRLEQPEEEDEGYKLRTEKFHDRKTKVLSDSYLFTWGDGRGGQLAQQNEDDILIPYVVNNPFKDIPIKECALGKHHSLFLTEKGYFLLYGFCKSPQINTARHAGAGLVFACGSGLYGQLGNSVLVEVQNRAVQIKNLKDIQMIAAGDHHSVAVTQVQTPAKPFPRNTGQRGLAQQAGRPDCSGSHTVAQRGMPSPAALLPSLRPPHRSHPAGRWMT
jgi:hypothetical protein